MPKAFLVLPQSFGYDDFYFYEDSPTLGQLQPEAIFTDRAEAEDHIRDQVVTFLMREGSPAHFFHREENEQLEPKELTRVRELLGLDSDTELAEYLAGFPDLDHLSEESVRELVDLMKVNPLCIVEADIEEMEFNNLKKGIGKRDSSEKFRQSISNAFGIPLDEDYPFDE